MRMRSKSIITAVVTLGGILIVVFFWWWHPARMPRMSFPTTIVVYENCRVISDTSLAVTASEYQMLDEWLKKQNKYGFSRCFPSCLPGVVVDCPTCEINFQDDEYNNDIILSIKDEHNPEAGWAQFTKTATEEDRKLRLSLMKAVEHRETGEEKGDSHQIQSK